MAKLLFSIGYAGFPNVNEFIQTLKRYGIQILVDVRSDPYSHYYKCYNKDCLKQALVMHGIYYFNYARQFGARQMDISLYKDGRLDFDLFSKSEQFLDGVQKVEKSNAVIAFMCAEKHPMDCHRAILVTRAFSDRGHDIIHILPNGRTLTQKDLENDLLDAYYPSRAQESLFDQDRMTQNDYIEAAYKLRNDEIGFKLEDLYK